MYLVECINDNCKKMYRKRSARERQGHCPECQVKIRKDGGNKHIGAQRSETAFLKRLDKVETAFENIESRIDLYLEAVKGEISAKIQDEAYIIQQKMVEKVALDNTEEVKTIEENLKTLLSTINNRMVKLSAEVENLSDELKAVKRSLARGKK